MNTRRGCGHRTVRSAAASMLAVLALGATCAGSASAADPVIAAAGDIACDPADSKFRSGNGTSDACRQLFTSNVMLDPSGAPNVNALMLLGDNQYYCGGPGSWDLSY